MPTDTRTILRRFPAREGGELIALFPDIDEGVGRCSSYMHVGQHGPADRGIVARTAPANPADPDAVALLAELRSIGYRPRVVRRFPARR